MRDHMEVLDRSGEETATHSERRKSTRVKLDRIVYLNLESGNGGIVLDISEQGLSLQTADQMDASGPMRFRFLAPTLQQIQVKGEIQWLDATQKRGGVRFAELPERVLQEIRGWMGTTATTAGMKPPAIPEEGPPAVPVIKEQAGEPTETVASMASTPTTSEMDTKSGPEDLTDIWLTGLGRAPRPAPTQDFPDHTRRLYAQHLEDHEAPWHRSMTLILALVVAAMLGLVGYVYKAELGNRLVAVGELLSHRTAAKPAVASLNSPDVAPPAEAVPAPLPDVATHEETASKGESNAAGNVDGNREASSEDMAPRSKATVNETITSEPPATDSHYVTANESHHESGLDGEAERQLAQQYLSQSNLAGAADLLWISVEKGNAEAEVELADFYGRGQGVKRNCQQARVLIDAASEKDGELASQELAVLHRLGCK